ncbi:SDR family NAD(P)-dependent oxidoreductase [Saccharibacillus kuerlensis]|uniref:Dehydrogenase n=1 Tax=Saccharibacillus kuerlensis TaxID=459527 RepID=A0ABQ2KWG9_9BACL|nr:SDR family NAD(P)-dependent oxidoreductase [Saccharibacillus kuerlensis]GGN94910.1 dehydrogenase [Saccharibacillus kuerlensis]
MHPKPVALITGANKGIGFQIAKGLTGHGFTVLVGSRDFDKGKAAAESIGEDARPLQIDVTDPHSLLTAAASIRRDLGRLDVLINNAGISHAGEPGRPLQEIGKSGRPSTASLDEVRAVFETNVFGVIAVTQAMLPLLRGAPTARIVNVSSGSGSLTLNADPTHSHREMFGAVYGPSKTALNAMTLAFAIELESTGIKVNTVCPGFTATDLNNFEGTGTTEQAARQPIRLALLDEAVPNGTFSNANRELPW